MRVVSTTCSKSDFHRLNANGRRKRAGPAILDDKLPSSWFDSGLNI